MKILAVDAQYSGDFARVAGVVFSSWTADTPLAEYVIDVQGVLPYRSGFFYERELPCILAMLDVMTETPDLIIVDGYADLGAGKPGLGRHLYLALRKQIPVVGVAKSPHPGASAFKITRGRSKTPFLVTSAGTEPRLAAEGVRSMYGRFKTPHMLWRADRLARGKMVPVFGVDEEEELEIPVLNAADFR